MKLLPSSVESRELMTDTVGYFSKKVNALLFVNFVVVEGCVVHDYKTVIYTC